MKEANKMDIDKSVTKNETKRDRFIRVAEARTNKIIDMIQLLGNCSNTATYDYTQEDVDQIFSTIESELRDAKKKYQRNNSNKNAKFVLKK